MRELTISEMGDIHETAMRVITKTGLTVENEDILKILKEKGIDVNFATQIVKLPKEEIYETIRQLVGCNALKFCENGVDYPQERRYRPNSAYFNSIGYMNGLIYDYIQNNIRYPSHVDMKNCIKMAKYLGMTQRTGVISFDVPQQVISIHALAMTMKYSNKPSPIEIDSLKDARWVSKLWDVYLDKKTGSKYASSYVSSKSPLVIGGRAAEIMLYQSMDGILTTVSGMPMTGASTPVTLVSSIVIHLAEHLGFNTVSRLICKGPNNQLTRRSIAFAPCMIDLRKGAFFVRGPESLIIRAAWNKLLGEFYKLPVKPGISMYNDAPQPGMQSVQEAAISLMAYAFAVPWYSNEEDPLAAGCLGSINRNLTLSYEQVLLDIELIQNVNHILKGITVNKNTLAEDIIDQVGHGGSFIEHEHTFENYKNEFWFPKYHFRGKWEEWIENGAKTPLEIAHEQVKEILAGEPDMVISREKAAAIDEIIKLSERDILGRETGVLP
jgi:trimethylamine--corrinoid protein Co-methyltransferase